MSIMIVLTISTLTLIAYHKAIRPMLTVLGVQL